MNRIEYNGASYTDGDIVSAELFSELSPISETLGYGTFSAVVNSETTALLSYTENTPLAYYYSGNLFATYYVNRIIRRGKSKYEISAYDIIGVLSKQQHMGGIYTGETAKMIITDVCGGIDIVFDEEIENIHLYGWLPISTRRDNLRRVLFAVGAAAKSTRSGELHITALSARVVMELNEIGIGAEVDYPEPVGSVSLTEHQFIKSANTETVELFEGITEDGDVITFDEPVYDLTGLGIAIKETHANYVIVGAGNGTVSGKKYVHAKRELTQTISGGSEEAIYDDATLVSVINSAAVLARLVNYHTQQDIITADTRHKRQAPGDTVNVLHPYDLNMCRAFILDRQITASRELVSYQRFLLGFVPPEPAEGVYNRVDVITASGTFVVPEGVTSLRVVLIGGGSGGESGLPGAAAGATTLRTTTDKVGDYTDTFTVAVPGPGGKGGAAGKAGPGGKVYQITIPVTPGQIFNVRVGAAGKGGAYSTAGKNTGTPGGESIFGNYTSENGSQSENGFLEEISGKQFAIPGQSGVNGGNGSGVENDEYIYASEIYYRGIAYYPGESKFEEYVRDYYPGTPNSSIETYGTCSGKGGGGAAAGANGNDAAGPNTPYAYADRVNANAGTGARGANAVTPITPTNYGQGGDGGNGGGGGGSTGVANAWKDGYYAPDATLNVGVGTPGAGGEGSPGGAGAAGVVLVYYYVPWTVNYSIFQLADGAELVTADELTFAVKKE